MNGYLRLANAIIEKAVEDYRIAYKQYLNYPYEKSNYNKVRELEQFFCSDYFCLLSKLDGCELLKKLKRIIEREESKV